MNTNLILKNKKVIKYLYFVFIFFLSFFILRNGVLCADDTFLNFFEFGISLDKDFLYGTWIMHLNNFLLYWIPDKLSFNIQDWTGSFGVGLQASCLMVMSMFFDRFFNVERLPIKITLPINFLAYMGILISFYNCEILEFVIFSAFFRFMIPSFLLIIFLYYLYKFFIGEEKYFIHSLILGVITASSSEIASVISISTMLLVFISKIICFNFKDKKYRMYCLLIFSGLIIASLCLFLSNGFHTHVAIKVRNESINCLDKLALFPEFIKLYMNKIICSYWGIYTTILISFFFNFFKTFGDEDEKIEKYFYPLFPVVGVWVFSFCLIFMGKTNYDGNFWLTHIDIHACFIPVLTLSVIISLSQFFGNFLTTKRKQCAILLVIINLCFLYPFCKDIQYFSNIKQNVKNFTYLKDKIRLFYEYRHETPIMPLDIEKFCIIFTSRTPELIDIDNFDKTVYDNPLDSVRIRVEEDKYYTLNYHKEVTNHFKDIILKDYNEALKIFKDKGGSYDEIKSGKYKFANLENENFVLNNKE